MSRSPNIAIDFMRALLLPKYAAKAASTRHRFLQYLPGLRDAGIHCNVGPLFGDAYLTRKFNTGRTPYLLAVGAYARRIAQLLDSKRYDLVVVHCELFPYLPRWFERLLTSKRIPYVLDLDDAIFLQYGDDAGPLVRWLCGEKMKQVFAESALVMAGNEYLAKYARKVTNWVEVVPTVVDVQRYSPMASATRDGFTVGWIGSPSTGVYLEAIAESLRVITAKAGGRVVVVGARDLNLPGVNVEYWEWSEAREVDDINQFDVGIMPLPDTPWARGKCGFKLIQYMACGLPVVASPVGVNADIVEHGVTGYLARNATDWTRAFERLRSDATLRARMGAEGRRRTEQSYSLQAMAPRVVSLLQEVVEHRGTAVPRSVAARS